MNNNNKYNNLNRRIHSQKVSDFAVHMCNYFLFQFLTEHKILWTRIHIPKTKLIKHSPVLFQNFSSRAIIIVQCTVYFKKRLFQRISSFFQN